MIRNILAVLAGIVSWGFISTTCNQILRVAMPGSFDDDGITESKGILVLVLVVSVIASFTAGLLTAALTVGDKKKVVRVLAIVQLIIGILVQLSFGERIPLWWNVIFLASVVPFHLAGGRAWLSRRA